MEQIRQKKCRGVKKEKQAERKGYLELKKKCQFLVIKWGISPMRQVSSKLYALLSVWGYS